MNSRGSYAGVFLLLLLFPLAQAWAQAPTASAEPQSPTASSAVALGGTGPDVRVLRILKFTGELRDALGRPRADTIAVTFALYEQAEGSAPLWLETQNVQPDEQGRYSVLLGATRSEGVPLELFTSGEARWLGVQPENEPEQPRVLLVSVPYALKAADAETLGGRPASAYQLVETAASTAGAEAAAPAAAGTTNAASGSAQQVINRLAALAGTGSQNFLAKWTDNAGTLGNSMIFDDGTFVGIGTASPAWPLDLVGNFQMQSSIEPFFRLNNTAYSAFDVLSGGGGTAVYNNALTFFRRTGSGTAKVIFDPSVGNVGIGTNTPEALLTVGPGAALALGHQSDVTKPYLGFGTYWDGSNLRAEGGSYLSLSLRAARSATVAANTLALGLYDGSGIVSDNLLLIKGDRSFGINDGTVANGAVSIRAAGTNQNITLTPSGTGNTVLNGNVTASGSVTATSFTGSGSGLTNVAASNATDVNCVSPCISTGEIVDGAVTSAKIADGTIVDADISSSAAIAASKVSGVATLGSNTFIGNQSITGNVTAASFTGGTGVFSAQVSAGDVVRGENTATTGATVGVHGIATTSSGGTGVLGEGSAFGVHALASTTSGIGVNGRSSATSGSTVGVKGLVQSSSGTAGVFENSAGGNLLVGAVSGVNKFRVDGTGAVFATAYNVGGADFAESIEPVGRKEDYEPGDVLVVDPNNRRTVARSTEPYSTRVAGIYSTKPGVVGSPDPMDDARRARELPLAVVGIVPCKVTAENGPIDIGDVLVTSSAPGHAMKGTDSARMLGAVVGKALEPLRQGTGVIQVLVTLR